MPSKKKRAAPLACPPKHPSRKRARKLTTEFHRLTRLRDAAPDAKTAEHYGQLIEKMGGREEYQRASQTSTSFFSTSKWVLGFLSRNGWLHGVIVDDEEPSDSAKEESTTNEKRKKHKKRRRPTTVLEIGAINTELLDAAAKERAPTQPGGAPAKLNNLLVRAVDLNAMHPTIEQADFLTIPTTNGNGEPLFYDVVVCSMVINCVTTPAARGQMMVRIAQFLRPDGLLFLTLPRTCLNLSPFIDKHVFVDMMRHLDLQVVETKESPKIAFFVCQKKSGGSLEPHKKRQWESVKRIRRGKKYRNEFAVVFPKPPEPSNTILS